MTFAELVLHARERLYDIRDASGAIITDAENNGIRWSSILMQQLCKSGLHQLIRTLVSLKLDNYYNESTLSVHANGKITKLTGLLNVSTVVSGEKIYKIMMIQEVGDRSAIYSYITPDKFYGSLYKIGLDGSNKYYTAISKPDDNTVIGKTNYIPATADVDIEVAYKRTIDTILNITSTEELPFVHLDDLMLDLVEEQGRLIEHNPTQLQSVQGIIDNKLKMLTLERKEK